MTALSYLSVIRFSGADAGDFLHNQLSADVLELKQGQSTFACYCEPRGRVLALMLIGRSDNAYYGILASELVSMISDRLKIYVFRSKVKIEVLDDALVCGHQHVDVTEADTSFIAVIPRSGGELFYSVLCGKASPETQKGPEKTWKLGEVQQGIVWLGQESSGQFLPQMLGFENIGAVNFRKGCYPGQEIVARTHYLGKVKRFPRLLRVNADLKPVLLDKIQLLHDGQSHAAVIVDTVPEENVDTNLFVVTRMDPELTVEQVEYLGRTLEVSATNDQA